jgi:hypothetical protein
MVMSIVNILGNLVFFALLWASLGYLGTAMWNKLWPNTYKQSGSSSSKPYLSGSLVFVEMLTTYPWLREQSNNKDKA